MLNGTYASGTTKLMCLSVATTPKILYKHNLNSLSLKRTLETDKIFYPLLLKASHHMWGFPKALLHLSPDYCGLGITSVTDRTFIKKWATLQSALHSDGSHSQAAEGLLYRAAATQGTHLVSNQGVILTTPAPKSKTNWWVHGLLEWGHTFGAHLCRKGHAPVDSGTAGPVIPLLPQSLHASCTALQIERLADLLELDTSSNLTWSASFKEFTPYLPEAIPTPILFPLTTTQFWASADSPDILQIVHISAGNLVIRRWSPDPDRLMTYMRSTTTDRLPYAEVFPGQTATRVSLLRSSPSEGTTCCRRLQPCPVVTSLPPAPKLPWILWVLDHLFAQQDYNPTFFTDGSYTGTSTIESIFRPQLTKCEAHASVVVMDSSPQWRQRPIITLSIRDIQEIG